MVAGSIPARPTSLERRSMIFLSKEDKKKIHLKFRGCWRKTKYTKEEADNVVFKMRWNGKSQYLNSYECKVCGGWHVGKRTNGKTEQI